MPPEDYGIEIVAQLLYCHFVLAAINWGYPLPVR